jgi:sugar phosphate isomerase/epimerase
MRFGICAPYPDIADLRAYPFDYLEENVQRFLMPERPQKEFERAWQEARQLPVAIEAANSLLPANLHIVATETQKVDTQRLEHYIRTALQRAEQAGMHILVFGSGSARACPADYNKEEAEQQIGEHLAQWSEWASEYGVEMVLEPLRYEDTNTLNTVTEAGKLVASIEQSGARLLADAYHMAYNNEDPDDIVPWASLLTHVHVAEKQERAAPGRYGEDFRPLFSVLHEVGYDQRVSIECNWQNLAGEVGPAIAVLKEQWGE